MQSILFTAEEFWPAFNLDMTQTGSHVIIHSPFLTVGRISLLARYIRSLIARGVTICVFAQKPPGWPSDASDFHSHLRKAKLNPESIVRHQKLAEAIELLQSWDVHVNLRESVHAKLAIIDRKIQWEGSLNILSHAYTKEHMRRGENKQEIELTIKKHALMACQQCESNLSKYGTAERNEKRLVSLGKLLTVRRKSLNLSQRDLARTSGIPNSSVSKIESGKNITVATIFRLSEKLELQAIFVPKAFVPSVTRFLERLSALQRSDKRYVNRR